MTATDETGHKPADHILDEFLSRHGVVVIGHPEFAGVLQQMRESILAESAPRPVIDREALDRRLETARGHSWSIETTVDAVMELARPVPTREQIAEALHNNDHGHQWREHGVCHRYACDQIYPPMADVVLELLNGSES